MTAHFGGLVDISKHDKPYNRAITFSISGLDVAIINSIRRVILSEVPNAGIPFHTYHPAQDGPGVRVLENDSVLHSEIVGHRLSLVPVCMDEQQLQALQSDEKFNVPCRYRFEIRVTNKTNSPMDVTTCS
eukprot:jgi/Chrzof1/8104/UNPLg00149.t1